jgi:hypothetical protein
MATAHNIVRMVHHLCIHCTRCCAIPAVCLDVISLVANSCGYSRGEIEPRIAHEFPAHVATLRGLAERPQHRHLPRAQTVAPLQ